MFPSKASAGAIKKRATHVSARRRKIAKKRKTLNTKLKKVRWLVWWPL